MSDSYDSEYLLLIGIKLSDAQIKSIQEHQLDLSKIKSLQKEGQWPDNTRAPVWKTGNNFENAVLVGYRKRMDTSKEDSVYLKTDGWFTTPEDLTNCNPVLDEQDKPTFIEEKGYAFGDMTAIAAKKSIVQGAQALKSFAESVGSDESLNGGKTRKRKNKRSLKSKRNRKSSRKYRK